MINQYDIAYGLGLAVSAPYWLTKPSARRKVRAAFSQRMGHIPSRDFSRPAVMIHAVSLGEMNATPALVRLLREKRPTLQIIISVTTETGFARGQELYASTPEVILVRYPLDFSAAVDRMLDALRPSVVALLELEAWPNFIRKCEARKIPVLLINGRVTPGSFRKYKWARPLVGSMFARLSQVCVQDEDYAELFVQLGVNRSRVRVTGTMKFDTAQPGVAVDGVEELAKAVGLLPLGGRVWVCGSTGPGEEQLILPVYRKLLEHFGDLELVLVPRHRERFEEVAGLIAATGFTAVRLSRPQITPRQHVILGDTIGDLRKFYALSEIVFVGRSLVDLGPRQHGSDMIEPAALAKPVIIGPFTANFADAMRRFSAAQALEVVTDAIGLEKVAGHLLDNPAAAAAMGQRAMNVVWEQRGATQRHAQIILDTLDSVPTMGGTG